MRSFKKLVGWTLAAIGATGLLFIVLRSAHETTRARWSVYSSGDARTGAELFRTKHCIQCHSVNGIGGDSGPDLGFVDDSISAPAAIVTAMWNHAPGMWELMNEEEVSYATLTQEEMSHLLAFLFTVRHVDEPGDSRRGQEIFQSKGCANCHELPDAESAEQLFPDIETTVGWARAMWNHPPSSDPEAERPDLSDREMADLLAGVGQGYARGTNKLLLDADLDHGWEVFQSKKCAVCHSFGEGTDSPGPDLGPGRQIPQTVAGFAGSMWNHLPSAWQAKAQEDLERPSLEVDEMADLIAFLYSTRYEEPGGGAKSGEVLFTARNCANCHGTDAEGSRLAPDLRGRGRQYSVTRLAEALWRHGPDMYEEAMGKGIDWPTLNESDVGDLITFLNTTPRQTETNDVSAAMEEGH